MILTQPTVASGRENVSSGKLILSFQGDNLHSSDILVSISREFRISSHLIDQIGEHFPETHRFSIHSPSASLAFDARLYLTFSKFKDNFSPGATFFLHLSFSHFPSFSFEIFSQISFHLQNITHCRQ